jgi:hypothetical protein
MASEAQQQIFDESIRHQLNLIRLEQGEARAVAAEVDRTDEELAGMIALFLADLESGVLTQTTARKLNTLERRITKLRGDAFDTAEKSYSADMEELVDHQVEWIDGLTRETTDRKPNPASPSKLAAIVPLGLFDGGTIAEYFEAMKISDIKRIMQQVQAGISNELSTREILNAVIGSRKFKFNDGVLQTTRNAILRTVRTTLQGVAVMTSGVFVGSNKQIYDREIYVAILDHRTSIQCSALAGTIWPVGEGPHPPIHPNCRSERYPVLKGEDPVAPTFDEWFPRQSRETKLDILGPSRLKLWQQGMPIKDMVTANNKVLTLTELRRLEN